MRALPLSRTRLTAWGVSMEEIKDMRTRTGDIKGANSEWSHGGEGSTTAHNEILDLVDQSNSFPEYKGKLQDWADTRLSGGRADLPDGLSE